jgi:hypothetical protein
MAEKLSLEGREWEDELFASMARVRQQPLAPDLPQEEVQPATAVKPPAKKARSAVKKK